MQVNIRRPIFTLIVLFTVLALSTKPAFSEYNDKKSEFLELINRYRQENGIAPLKISNTLTKAAQLHSEDMANQNYFSHTSLDGRTFVDRMRQTGYKYNTWLGENIAAGYDTAQSVFDAWKNSPGHNANMLNPDFVVIGIGIAYNSSSTYCWYWTTDFGGYDDTGGNGHNPPRTPQTPSGPTLCATNVTYVYSAYAYDPDGDEVQCVFDWGDGTSSVTAMGSSGSYFRAEHAWCNPGVFQVRVQVLDSQGEMSPWSKPLSVVVKLISTISISISSASVSRGEMLVVSGFVSPPHDCTIIVTLTKPDGSQLVEQTRSDKNGNYTWIVSPDVDGTWSVVASWAGDQDHLGSTSEELVFKVEPPVHRMVFESNVEGTNLIVDGVNYSLPCSFMWKEGTIHKLVAEATHIFGEGVRYSFIGWSDGCSLESRDVVVSCPATYRIIYTVQYLILVNMWPGCDQIEAWHENGTKLSLSINATLIYQGNFSRLVFAGWSENVTSTEIAFIVNSPKFLETQWKSQFFVRVNSPYGEKKGEGWYDEGSQACIYIHPPVVEFPNSTRRVFDRWVGEGSGSYSGGELNVTLEVKCPMVEYAIWKTQYFVEVYSAYGHPIGNGWYDASSSARISVEPVINETNTTRFVFSSWCGLVENNDPELNVVVNSPLKLEAVWKKELFLNVCSSLGSTWGSGWYLEGSVASFGVTPPPLSIIPDIFDGWTGDVISSNLNVTTIMDRPKRAIAKWRRDTSAIGLSLIVGGIALPAFLFGKNKLKRKKETQKFSLSPCASSEINGLE